MLFILKRIQNLFKRRERTPIHHFPVRSNLPELKASTGQDVAINTLKFEYILQRYRDVWEITTSYPFLILCGGSVKKYFNEVDTFPVFGGGFLFQNISPNEFKRRVITSLAGPGLTGGTTAKGELIVKGQANPKAFGYIQFNDILILGGECLFSSGTRFQVIEKQKVFQYEIGKLVTVNKKSRPQSELIDFSKICELRDVFHQKYINQPRSLEKEEIVKFDNFLSNIFNENAKNLEKAFNHHLNQNIQAPRFDYFPPEITKYGRLSHSETTDTPQIEYNLSLLHYEKALTEFDKLKRAVENNDKDFSFVHGIYCIVALAACIESIANMLFHKSQGRFRTYQDQGTPIEKINSEATSISADEGISFAKLEESSDEYISIETVRKLRNKFMHYIEEAHDIELGEDVSVQMASVSEENCRKHLKNLRRGIEFIFKQLPKIPTPIVSSSKIKWLGEKEVP